MEKFKPINGYEGIYSISDKGNVISHKRIIERNDGVNKLVTERVLKPNIGTNGYYYVSLSKNGKSKTHYIHRLVAFHFIDNPQNLSDVDHIDENKLNNDLSNLRWLSHLENSSRSNKGKKRYDTSGSNNPRAKNVYCSIDGEIIKVYECAKYITDEYGINYSTLRKKLQNIKMTINNMKFYYD